MENQPTARTCSNCACFARMQPDGSVLLGPPPPDETAIGQPVCRRITPNGRYSLHDVPLFDPKTGAPINDARGRQRVERRNVLEIGYPPVVPEAVCFDGWRKLGTEPGERV